MKRLFIIITLSFSACQHAANQEATQSKPASISEAQIMAHGNSLSAKAQNLLLNQVSSAMAEGGPVKAIHYCNLSATGLLATISEESGAVIKRVALKNRNPQNYLKNKRDSTVYFAYETELNSSGDLSPTVFRENGEVHFYKPILMQMSTCLKCHGSTEQDIDANTLAAIFKRYPADKAVNFKLGELRGLWKISFPSNSLITESSN